MSKFLRFRLRFPCPARYTREVLSGRQSPVKAPYFRHRTRVACLIRRERAALSRGRFTGTSCRAGRLRQLVLSVVTALTIISAAVAQPTPPLPANLSPAAQQLARQGFLVLFYLPTCPHCQRFAPVITRYAQHQHLELVTVSLNGQALPTLPETTPLTPDLRQAFFQGQGASVPALFYVDATDAKILPVSVGEATVGQLTERLNQLAPQVYQAETNPEGQ